MPQPYEIASNALYLIGDKAITSGEFTTPTTDRGKIAAALWPTARDFVLRSHPWNCVVKRAVLNSPGMSSTDKSSVLVIAGKNMLHDSTGTQGLARGTSGLRTGKGYFEVEFLSASVTGVAVGVADLSAVTNNFVGFDANGWAYLPTGNKINNNSGAAYGATYAATDVIGVAIDMGAGTLVFYKNGATQGTAYSAGLTGKLYPAISMTAAAQAAEVRMLSGDWRQTVPTGFSAFPAAAPAFEWPYEFHLPSDSLRLLAVGEETEVHSYRLERGKILSDENDLGITYIYQETDPTKYDASLVASLEAYLAMKLAYPITKSNTTVDAMAKVFTESLRVARTVDGLEQPNEEPQDFPLLSVRR